MGKNQVGIRKATPDDAGVILALTDAAYTKYIPRIGRKPQPMTADYSRMVVEDSIWLLTLENQPIGVLVLVYEPENVLVYSVAIKPEYQKQGLGRRLLAWAEQQAVQAGYRSIRLYTNERFEENIRLYERLGYQETGREPLLGSTVVHMAKRLGR
jgi:GNAT superfamily N-acetyltransferase